MSRQRLDCTVTDTRELVRVLFDIHIAAISFSNPAPGRLLDFAMIPPTKGYGDRF